MVYVWYMFTLVELIARDYPRQTTCFSLEMNLGLK